MEGAQSSQGTVTVKVRFFAALRERLGKGEVVLELPVDSSITEIWRQATGEDRIPDNTLVAVNLEYADLQHRVREGDEVAFFPPVTGG